MDKIVSNTLKDLGISPALHGFAYIRDAIKMALEQPYIIHSMTKQVYPKIAARYSTTSTRVERCMRFAIECAWDYTDNPIREEIFRSTIKYTRGKPTNGEFIATVADYIQIPEVTHAL